ncbi:MAG TPA: sigma-70 family RNA polymerase sigma factor [Gaiellaceae bacterium]|nr:sigma-70 family RNA polymerase sigma factor [Gaiellaceae bacterium]
MSPPTDRGRFESILDRHHRRLRRVVAGMIGDANRVDDVLQEAYLKAYRRLPKRFANEAHEATWIYRVVYRCCLDELRRGRRNRESPCAEIHSVGRARLEVAEALAELRPQDRAMLLLVDLLGFGYEEAATVLKIPRGTVASRLSAARTRFARKLDE